MDKRWGWVVLALTATGGILLISALALVGLSYFRSHSVEGSSNDYKPSGALAVGNPAPDFSLKTLDGQEFTLSDLVGKPVVINFWATWCPPCKEEMPLLEDYSTRYGNRFTMLAVDYGDSESEVQAFIDELQLSLPVLMDPGDQVNSLYRIQGYPTTYFIDSDGNIADLHVGLISASSLKKYMQLLGVIK